ncbi:Peptide transporter PTR2 [Triticum urartu]|uniref:Peptide transporter PTR2 n=1 Tax=Triticum urartu TaxID=4572 RepID=M7YLT1_TRIUA|nr:Peptide transporter PTR2 [Triticum urartu]
MASAGEHTVALLARLPAEAAEAYATDGSLDFDGNPALRNRTGTEFCYCVAFYGISFNLVTYLTGVLGQSNVAAATNVSTWQATCFLMPLAGAVVADSYWGRYRTMVVSFFIGVAGMLMAALSAYLPLLVKNGVLFRGLTSSNIVSVQEFLLFLGLYMIAVGLGGLRPCLMSFGADQFDDGDPVERAMKGSFFNWYVFNMSCASLMSSNGIVWMQDRYGWAVGLTIPAVVLVVGLSCLVAASRRYRYQRTRGSPLTRVCQVVVAAVRKFRVELPADSSLLYDMPPEDDPAMKGVRRIEHTTDLRSVAAILRGLLVAACTLLAPIHHSRWICCLFAQILRQGRHCRGFGQGGGDGSRSDAAAAQPVETLHGDAGRGAQDSRADAADLGDRRLLLCHGDAGLLHIRRARHGDGRHRRLRARPARVHAHLRYTHSNRPGPALRPGLRSGCQEAHGSGEGNLGAAEDLLTMTAAALLETARLRAAKASPLAPNTTSLLWQAPQYALEGVGELLATIGQLDFFYSQAPATMKTVCTALGLLAVAAGGYLSSFLLTALQWATARGGGPGWIPDDLNEGHLDRFFWMMAGLGCLNLMAFGSFARMYESKKSC